MQHFSEPTALTAPILTLRTVDLRRAVFALLLESSRPMSLGDLVAELELVQHIDLVGHLRVSPRQRICDLLWWEIERGHVQHVGAGRYRLRADTLSPTTRWRCAHWRTLLARRSDGPR